VYNGIFKIPILNFILLNELKGTFVKLNKGKTSFISSIHICLAELGEIRKEQTLRVEGLTPK